VKWGHNLGDYCANLRSLSPTVVNDVDMTACSGVHLYGGMQQVAAVVGRSKTENCWYNSTVREIVVADRMRKMQTRPFEVGS